MKQFFLLVAVVFSVMAASAQVKYGVKGGLNLSNVGGKDVEDNKMKIGFHVGGLAQIPVVGNISVQPELVLSAQGAKFEADGDDGKLNFLYVNVPVMAKYTFDEGFFAETGPQIGFLASAKAKQGSESSNVKENYKTTDFSWGIGVGYLSKSNIGANARFNFGLSKLDKDGETKMYNRTFQVGLVYIFGE